MVERLAAHFCGFDIYAQVFLGLGLTDVIRHRLGAERIFGLVLRQLPGGDDTFIIRHAAGKFNTQRNTLPYYCLTSFLRHWRMISSASMPAVSICFIAWSASACV